MQSRILGGLNGLDDGRIAHMAIHDLFANARATAFHAKLNNFAICSREIFGSVRIKKSHMRIDDKGEFGYFFIRSAERFYIILIVGEEVVVKDKHFDAAIVIEEILNFRDDVVYRKMSDVIQRLKAAAKIMAIRLYHMVVETVGAGKGTSPGGHEPHPALFGINNLLKIEEFIIFKRQPAEIGQSADRINPDFSV